MEVLFLCKRTKSGHIRHLSGEMEELPEPSDYEEAIKKAELIKSDFDYTRGYLTLVDVDFQPFDRA